MIQTSTMPRKRQCTKEKERDRERERERERECAENGKDSRDISPAKRRQRTRQTPTNHLNRIKQKCVTLIRNK